MKIIKISKDQFEAIYDKWELPYKKAYHEQQLVELTKELENYYKFQLKIEQKLDNKDFLSKAPKNIIESEIEKYNSNWRKISDLELLLLDTNASLIYEANICDHLNTTLIVSCIDEIINDEIPEQDISFKEGFYHDAETILKKQLNIENIFYTEKPVPNSICISFNDDKIYIRKIIS